MGLLLLAGAALFFLMPKASGPGASTVGGGSGLPRGRGMIAAARGASSNPTTPTRALVVGSLSPKITTTGGQTLPPLAPLDVDDSRVISGVVNIGIIGSSGPFRGL